MKKKTNYTILLWGTMFALIVLFSFYVVDGGFYSYLQTTFGDPKSAESLVFIMLIFIGWLYIGYWFFIISWRLAITNGSYRHTFFLRLRLNIASIKWHREVIRLKTIAHHAGSTVTNDEMQELKEKCFGELLQYADDYKP